MSLWRLFAAALALTTLAASPSPSPSPSAEPLELQAQNPISTLARIPFQYNARFNYGYARLAQQTLNVQPAYASQLGGNQLLVTRVILPIRADPPRTPNGTAEVGIGDLNAQLYYVPKEGATMVGFGPAFLLPTASSAGLGSERWSAGPDFAIAIARPKSLFYVLMYNVWSFAGDPTRKAVNRGNIQPNASWSLGNGFSLGFTSSTTVNWTATGANKWTVPFGPTWSQLVDLGSGSKGTIGGGFFWNVVHPVAYGPTWTARMTFTLLFPH